MTKLIDDARHRARPASTIVHAHDDSQLRAWTETASTTTYRRSTVELAGRDGRFTLMTGNHEDNAPTRRVNDALGYRRLCAEVTRKGGIG